MYTSVDRVSVETKIETSLRNPLKVETSLNKNKLPSLIVLFLSRNQNQHCIYRSFAQSATGYFKCCSLDCSIDTNIRIKICAAGGK